MKTIYSLLMAFGLLFTASEARTQNLPTIIKVQAMEMGNAFVKNDVNRFLHFMHPDIVSFAGGKETMKTKMDSAYQTMQKFKVRVKRYWIGSVGEIYNYKNQLQAVFPQSTTLLTPLGELTAESAIIAISADKGKNWWFIDTRVYNADKLKKLLPDLSPDLVLPPLQKPKLERLKAKE